MANSNMDVFAVQQQLRSGGQISQDLSEVFHEEAGEHIRTIYDRLDRLRVELRDFDALADVRRSCHTLKGAAGAVGHEAIARLSHRMEDLLDSLFECKRPLVATQLELLLITTDHIQDLSLRVYVFDEMVKSLRDIYRRFDEQFESQQSLDASAADFQRSARDTDERTDFEKDAERHTTLDTAQANTQYDQLFGSGFNEEFALDATHVPASTAGTMNVVSRLAYPFATNEPKVIPQSTSPASTPLEMASVYTGSSVTDKACNPEYLSSALEQLKASVDIQPEILAIYSEEAQDLLRAVYQGLEGLKHENGNHAALSDVRRSAHTLKGAAGAVGMVGVTRLAHRMEDLLDALADRHQPVTSTQLQTLLETADRIQDLTNGDFEMVELAECMANLYAQYDREMESFLFPYSPNASNNANSALAKTDKPLNIEHAERTLANGPEANDLRHVATQSNRPEINVKADPKQAKSKTSSTSGQYLRVPLERIDGLVALIGEMVVNRSALNQKLGDFENRIQDMQLAVNRFRAVAQDIEQSFGVEAMQTSARELKVVTLKNGHAAVNRIAAYTKTKFASTGSASAHAGLDSLEFDRYTKLHLLSRSIAEATNDIAVITSEFRNIYGDIDSLLERQQRYNRDAQDGLMQIRMLPIASIVSRLERTVRTVSNKLGKNVDLVVVGETIELDKTVLEEITEPVLHLIRNALDHGIETSEQRAESGKPTRARLTVETLNQGTQVALRVSDDGRGLDLNKIREKAIEQGVIDEHTPMSIEELHDLIFLQGFSTADRLTDVSGRGIGMDVVRDAVQRLKGTIRVESTPGKGATFTIHLPTSLSMTRALIVASNSNVFAIPMQSVEQIMRLDTVTTTRIGTQTFIKRDDQLLPLNDLAHHLATRSEPLNENASGSQPVLLIRSGDHEVAVIVDAIKGGQDIVVKTLGDHLRHVPGYLGATLAGDGTVIPILDPTDLCGTRIERRSTQLCHSNEARMKRRKTAMVVDDSLSVRRVTTNLLRSHGWDVIDAKDGLDAIEKLSAHDSPPDIFLCDMEMPRMDGLELVARLRSMSEFTSTPIVMVTSRSGEKHRRLATEAGANEHVVKPFKDDQFISLIEKMVVEHRELVGI